MDHATVQAIRARMDQAHETLKEADVLFEQDFWRGTINRSYYAMFYSVLALAVLREQITSKHSGVIAFFDREYVKPGIFSKELSHALHLAFERRQTTDYGEIFTVSEEEAKQALHDADAFVTRIESYIYSTRNSQDS